MDTLNICKHIGCRHFNNDRFLCGRFGSARNCPVSLIKGIEGTEYALSLSLPKNDEALGAVVCAAKAVCPDPVVRIQALGDWPVEAIEYTQVSDDFDETANVQAIHDAIESLRIGPIPD